MIANKDTELRLISNLNDLLEDSKERQEINKKIHKHTFNYMMGYVSDCELEDNIDMYDKLEELSNNFNVHSWEIAKLIKNEILEENGDEIDVYVDETNRETKKELYLNPKKFTKDFKVNLLEDINNLIVDDYFKELDRVIKVLTSKDKIDKLRKKNNQEAFKDNKIEIENIINDRLERYYQSYVNRGYNASLILTNINNNRDFIDEITQNSINGVCNALDLERSTTNINNIVNLSEKLRKAFVRDKKSILGVSATNKVQVEVPKYVKWYAISKIFKDMTK